MPATLDPTQVDPRIGRRVTWNVYSLQFEGTVIRPFNDPFDGEEFLAVTVEKTNDGPPWYPGIPASIYPPGTPGKGNARWL